MHIMVVPSWYSSDTNKVHGSFFKEQFIALQKSGEKITVAYNEIWPITSLGRMKKKRGIFMEVEDGLNTYRYRDYNYFPKNPKMFDSFNKRMEKLYLEIVEREGKVDVIHAHSAFWGAISAAYVAKKYNVPLVITEHSSLKNSKYVRSSYIPFVKNAYNSADKLIAVGNGLKEEMKNYTKKPIEVICNLLNEDRFNVKDKSKENEGIVLFSLAYLVEGKGMEALVRAFSKAFSKESEVFLRIGGDGEKRGEIERVIEECNIKDKVTLLGLLSRDKVLEEMNRCNGFVLASEHETFGVVYIEALAVGKPILGTKNGGAEDIIKDYNGIIVENKNEDALVEGLIKFKNNLSKFDSKVIREKAIENYSQEVIVNKIKEIYRSI